MKSSLLTIAVFAIMLFSSQVAFGQSGKVVCYDDNTWYQTLWIDAPYVSADLIAEADASVGAAAGQVSWNDNYFGMVCPDECGFKNIGRHDAGGVNVDIMCRTYGYGSYAVAEAWAEW